MGDGLEAGLLNGSGSYTPPAPWWRRKLLVALLCAAGLAAVMVCVHKPIAKQTAAVDGQQLYDAAATDGRLAMGSTFASSPTECFDWTGGTCTIWGCHASRGKTACARRGLTFRCVCVDGCSGGNGKCYSGVSNKLVAPDFTLKNVAWPDQKMYIPSGIAGIVEHQIRTSASESSAFNMYRLPDSAVMLSSVKWPDYVMDMSLSKMIAVAIPGVPIPFVRWDVMARQLGSWWQNGLLSASFYMCRPHDHPDAIQLSNMYEGTIANATVFVRHLSWKVYGYSLSENVGTGGYWIPEPPLPFEPPLCA